MLKALLAALAVTGSLAAQGDAYDIPGYGGPWAVLHHDNRNSNYAAVPVARHYREAYRQGGVSDAYTYNRPVIAPNGNVYFTYKIPSEADDQGHLVGYVGKTGERVAQVDPPALDGKVAAGNALVGTDGSLYVADGAALTKFTAEGETLWRMPVDDPTDSPTAPQLTPDGNLLLMTSHGYVYVVDPADGRVLLAKNLTPNRVYPTGPRSSFLHGGSPAQAFVNTPAVDPGASLIYQTFKPAQEDAPGEVRAYLYGAEPYDVKLYWRNESLDGGSGTSIAVSADYRRLYVHDRAGHLLALDTATGLEAWRVDVGYDANSAPLVTPNGYVVPGLAKTDPDNRLWIVKDNITSARRVFTLTGFQPLSTAAAGRSPLDGSDRFVVVAKAEGSGAVKILVIEPEHGIIGSSDWGSDPVPRSLIGISLDEQGWLYVNAWDGAVLKVFRPVTDE